MSLFCVQHTADSLLNMELPLSPLGFFSIFKKVIALFVFAPCIWGCFWNKEAEVMVDEC